VNPPVAASNPRAAGTAVEPQGRRNGLGFEVGQVDGRVRAQGSRNLYECSSVKSAGVEVGVQTEVGNRAPAEGLVAGAGGVGESALQPGAGGQRGHQVVHSRRVA